MLIVSPLLIGGSRALKTTIIKPVLVVVAIVVGMPIATRTTPVMTEVGVVLILGKIGQR